MAKTKISEYDADSQHNTMIDGINIGEGCSPAGINDAIRKMMAHLKRLQQGTSGDTIPITAGGTGTNNADQARTNLNAAERGNNSTITSLSALSTPLLVSQGGTGSASLSLNSVLVGNGSSTVQSVSPGAANNVLTSNGSVWESQPLTVVTLPAGAVQYFAMNSAPSGWLKANGEAISRVTYANLFSAIGETYGPGDGSSTFNLPDLRGEFIRSWNDDHDVDSGRIFGSTQTQNTNKIRIKTKQGVGTISYDEYGPTSETSSTYPEPFSYSGTFVAGLGAWVMSVKMNNEETRPRNIALLACIKT